MLLFHSNRILFLLAKLSVYGWALDLPNHSTFLMMDSGMGYAVSFHRLIFFPVIMMKNLYVPCRFPVGPRTIARVKQVTTMFVKVGSLLALQ